MTDFPITDHIPSLRRYARSLTGDAWAADDLVQDTLERACSKWHLWLAGSDLRAWLFTMMYHVFINQIGFAQRRGNAATHINIDDVEHELASTHAGDVTELIDLQRCLLRLPEEQRAVLLLVTQEDLSYEAVAKIVGVPVGTVMSRLSRARSRLQDLMNGSATTAKASFAPHLRVMK